MGAPQGNTNGAKKNRAWRDTLRREATKDPEKLRKIALALFEKALDGDIAAIKELGDRLDGKAVQAIVGDSEHDPVKINLSGLDNSDLEKLASILGKADGSGKDTES